MAVIKKRVGSLKKKAGGEETEKLSLRLPQEPSHASDDLSDYTGLLYGLKKIGKTSMCQYFDGAFFMMLEPGAKAMAVYQTVDEDGKPRVVRSWAEFKEWVKLLEKDKRFKIIIVDPVDRLYRLCEKAVCQKLAISHPSEEEWGKGWGAVRDEFDEWVLGRLMNMGKGVIFISHAKEAEIKTRTGEKYHTIISTMPSQAREAIEGVVDFWGYYSYEGKERILILGGDDHIDAGHRISKHFRYTDGERIRQINMGKSEKEAYRNFRAAFNNELEPPAPEEVKKPKKLSLKIKKK